MTSPSPDLALLLFFLSLFQISLFADGNSRDTTAFQPTCFLASLLGNHALSRGHKANIVVKSFALCESPRSSKTSLEGQNDSSPNIINKDIIEDDQIKTLENKAPSDKIVQYPLQTGEGCRSSGIPTNPPLPLPLPNIASRGRRKSHRGNLHNIRRNLDTTFALSYCSTAPLEKRNDFSPPIVEDDELLVTQTDAQRNTIVQSQLHVDGICCSSEIPTINSIVTPLRGVNKISINVTTKIVYVDHDKSLISVEEIEKKLNLCNFRATVQKDGENPLGKKEELHNSDRKNKREFLAKSSVALSGVFWTISMMSYIPRWHNAQYFALGSVLFGFPPIALKAINTLRCKRTDANCLMFFAVVGALILREFTEAAAVSFLFSIGDILERRATRKARDALSEIVSIRPEVANVIDDATNGVSIISAEGVSPGHRLLVRPGEKIPCDGVVLKGVSVVDECSLTGESRPTKKLPNSNLSGGTINVGTSPLVMIATATIENSAAARLIRMVEQAQANRSPTEKLVDRFSKLYTPVVGLSAFLMCTIPWMFGKDLGKRWFLIGLTTTIVACPCALIISTPVTYVAGLAALAKRGVIVKGGAHLEALGRVGKVALDKTGTLTQGKFKLLHLDVVGSKYSRKEILGMVAALEGPSVHPLANALFQAAQNEGTEVSAINNVEEHTIVKGEGVHAYLDGKKVYIGNRRLFTRINMYSKLDSSVKEKVDHWSELGGTVGYVGVEGVGIVAAYCAADEVRTEAQNVVEELKESGIAVSMLTGDSTSAAIAVGKQVGLPYNSIQAELLPEEKLNLVQEMKVGTTKDTSFLCSKKKRDFVLMCGDGINDSPALASADVGVAMGAGSTLALETSDVTLVDNNLDKLLKSILMGRKVIRTIKQNIAISMLSKLAVFMLVAFKGANLWFAIASDVGAMLIVTLNGMKLLPKSRKLHNAPFNQFIV
uniref:HMA domain-containing protein n=1 Tax=Corethron hystrix TaxID=216773 RepID=A0A7S1G1E3_9STRA|mmetsp:Transcript_5947/g.12644  ORF Transcript_5947/g.12644 Transcript_5947/m.12644 type:complete len:945 (+) Transcript_5947:81-2915(+)